ncbi:MAG: hypothetical protein R3Y24_02840 [Eubacteriales bacterium]
MMDPFYEQDMDIKEYINKRILEIDSLSDRILYKEMASSFMTTLFEIQREESAKLTEKVLSEVSFANYHYDISIGMTEKSKYDGTDTYLFPIIVNEVSKNIVADINFAIENNTPYFLENIFVKDFYPKLAILSENNHFKGIIKTTDGEYKVIFSVAQDTRYIEKLKDLFEAFRNNGAKWNTVILAYLVRTYAISVISVDTDKIKGTYLGFSIDFGDYEYKIIRDVMPLWNIKMFTEKTNSFPICIEDGLKYEHSVLIDKKQKGSKVIVGNLDADLYATYSIKNQISIVSTERNPKEWLFYEILDNIKEESYSYPVLSNHKKENLTSNLRAKYQGNMSTKAEIIRLIEESPFADKLSLVDIKISNTLPSNKMIYDMNAVFSDDVTNNTDKKVLTLIFSAKNDSDYLIYDYMSFITTNISKVLREYVVLAELEA